jgi:hypothetical protein
MNKLPEITFGVAWAGFAEKRCEDESLFTIIISPRHPVHAMDKRTRANGNGDSAHGLSMTRFSRRKNNLVKMDAKI